MMSKPIIPTTECSNCSAIADHKWLLHHVRLRGIYRRLCTSCVLKLHPGSFCPTCFDIFESLPPLHRRVICQKCPSISHPDCIPSSENSKAYTCPPCATLNYSFFDVKKKGEENGGDVKMINKGAATVLLCAARIAAMSMSRAMVIARAEAEKRVKEAALSRKRAREALEHVSSVAAKEKARKHKDGLLEAEGSVHVGMKEKASIQGNGGNKAIMKHENRIENKVTVDGVVDDSGKIAPDLDNKVGSREKGRSQEDFSVKNEELGSHKNGATVAVKEGEKEKTSNGNEIRQASLENHGTVSELERSENVANLSNHNTEGEKANNGLLPLQPVEGKLKHKESSYDRKEDTILK